MRSNKRFIGILIGVWVGVLLAGGAYLFFGKPPAQGNPEGSVSITPIGAGFQTSWQNETQYIVEGVLHNLCRMVFFAKTGKRPSSGQVSVSTKETREAGKLAYDATLRVGDQTFDYRLVLNGSVWSPEVYEGLSRLLLRGVGGSEGRGSPIPFFVEALSSPTPQVLLALDGELSQAMGSAPSEPVYHVDAALLLGAFALREASGPFYEVRSELNQMTAHLVMGRALGGSHSPRWDLAEAALLVLQNNQREALVCLDRLPDSSEFLPWKRALFMRATSDYRRLEEGEDPTLLELREAFRARCLSLSTDLAVIWMSRVKGVKSTVPVGSPSAKSLESWRSLPDWNRLLWTQEPSVGVGRQLISDLSLEFAEAGEVYRGLFGRPLKRSEVCEELNVQPVFFGDAAGGENLSVLGWPRWAPQLQRHICGVVLSAAIFLQEVWGVPEFAQQFRSGADALFSGLRLYPFVGVMSAVEQRSYEKAQDDARRVMLTSPQVVSPQIWNATCYERPQVSLYVPPPHAYVNEWHVHNPPPGTAYDPFPRMNHPSLVSQPDTVSRLEELHERAPYDPSIGFNLIRLKYKGTQTPQQVEEVYQKVLDYYPSAVLELASRLGSDPVQYEQWLLKAAKLNPSCNEVLARHYRKVGEPEKSLQAYLDWMAQESDTVAVAAEAGYVVKILEGLGRVEEASELARRAAETYSWAGLEAQADLLEARGDWEGAHAEHQKIVERYADNQSLVAFLLRADQKAPRAEFGAELQELLPAWLPSGLVEFRAGSLSPPNPPESGVLVSFSNSRIKEAGLLQGDVIVAVRGYEVSSWRAFKLLRDLYPDTPFSVVVWRAGSYVSLGGIPSDLRFGKDLPDYKVLSGKLGR